jgi:hypothetical protein
LISPNFFAKQKVAGARRLAKKLQFNFTNKAVRLILGQYVRHLPNTVCQKRRAQMLMKLTPVVKLLSSCCHRRENKTKELSCRREHV